MATKRELEDRIQHLDALVEHRGKLVEKLREDRDHYKEKSAKADNERDSVVKRNAELEQENALLRCDKADLDKLNEELNDEINELVCSLEDLDSLYHRSRRGHTRATEEASSLLRAIGILRRQVDALSELAVKDGTSRSDVVYLLRSSLEANS